MALKITGEHAAVLSVNPATGIKMTTVVALTASLHPSPFQKFTQIFANVGANPPPPHQRMTQCFAQILCTRSPLYRTIAMVLADVFPNDISYNSVGSTRFATDVIVVDSGDDQRVQRWAQPLMEYDVAYGIRTMEQLLMLISFFRAMRGRFYSFCYQDNVDFTSSLPVKFEARSAPPIQCTDQVLGVGDGLTYVWQLVKNYNSSTQSQQRTISRPQPGTTIMGVNAAKATNFTVDETTGLVTFTSPLVEAIGASVAFNGAGQFSGPPGTFSAFLGKVGSNVLVSGMANPVNNVSWLKGFAITGIASDGRTLQVSYGSGFGNVAETVASGLVISIHPAPPVGSYVTAGYLFFVPVRFDTDILPVTIEDYGVGGSNSVKLIEVRSSDS